MNFRFVSDDLGIYSRLAFSLSIIFTGNLFCCPKIKAEAGGDRVLILESCTHQVNCDDIGRYKIPTWISDNTGKKREFPLQTTGWRLLGRKGYTRGRLSRL